MPSDVQFLEFFQLGQVTKQCAGEECPDVNEDQMAQAKTVDDAREKQPASCHNVDHERSSCHDCKGVASLAAGLAARLEAGGIMIPQYLL